MMRIFCWNVNSLVPTVRNINLKYGSLAAFFRHLDADIVCMQEVKLPSSKLTKDLVVVEGYQSYWACSEGKTGYSGVTTWAREEVAAVSVEADALVCEGCEQEGRALVTDHGSFVLFNVYVPNAGDRPARARLPAKLAFLEALRERIDSATGSGRQVIAVGDFNVAAQQRDVHSAITWDTLYHPSELTALHALLNSCCDTWRTLHPDEEGVYTVWDEKKSARAFNVGLRIDYMLCSKQLLQHVKSCEIMLDMPPKWSDHAPLLLEIEPPAAPPGAQASQQQQQQQQPVQCAMWRQLLKRFADPTQRSIASMFAAAPKASTASGAAGSKAAGASRAAPAAPATGVDAGTSQRLPAKRSIHDLPAAEEAQQDAAAGASAAAAAAGQNSAGWNGSSRGTKAAKVDAAGAGIRSPGAAGAAAAAAGAPAVAAEQQQQQGQDLQEQQQQQTEQQQADNKQGSAANGSKPANRRLQPAASKGKGSTKQAKRSSSNKADPKQPSLRSFLATSKQ